MNAQNLAKDIAVLKGIAGELQRGDGTSQEVTMRHYKITTISFMCKQLESVADRLCELFGDIEIIVKE